MKEDPGYSPKYLYNKKWVEENPEKTSQYQKNYYNRNKEKRLEAVKKRCQENPEKVKQREKVWRERNKDKI
jgi:phenolic acid decarboxylase